MKILRRKLRRFVGKPGLIASAVGSLLGIHRHDGYFLHAVGGVHIEYSLDSVIGQVLFDTGVFEPHEMSMIEKLLRGRGAGAVMLDIGANIGLHSIAAAQLREVDRVFAFEPACATLTMLERNIARNGLEGKIQVQPFAVGRSIGSRTFHVCVDNAYSSLVPDGRSRIVQTYNVSQTSVDEWSVAIALDRIDLIKIDVEGGEPDVIAGAVETLRRYRPELIVEIYQGSRTDFSATKLIGDICALGYSAFVLIDGVDVAFQRHDDAQFNYHFRPTN